MRQERVIRPRPHRTRLAADECEARSQRDAQLRSDDFGFSTTEWRLVREALIETQGLHPGRHERILEQEGLRDRKAEPRRSPDGFTAAIQVREPAVALVCERGARQQRKGECAESGAAKQVEHAA